VRTHLRRHEGGRLTLTGLGNTTVGTKFYGRLGLTTQGQIYRGRQQARFTGQVFLSLGGTPLSQTGSGVVAIVPMD
jgi:hypothetical protein